MKKTLLYIFSIFILCVALVVPAGTVYAADITITAKSSSVNIGDSVTVTVTVPENISGTLDVIYPADLLEFTQASAEVNSSKAGTVAISIGKYGLVTSNKVTITFKAKTAGDATVKTKGIDFFDNNGETDSVVLGDSSTKITIKNETSSEDTLSSDYYLAKLNITAGSKKVNLSPTFNYRKTNYTATVDYDVTDVVVSVTRSSGKAEIVSMTDNGKVKLDVGANKIEIVVKAENGKTLTYVVTITRKEKPAETQQPENPTENPGPTEDPEPATPDFEHGGVQLYAPTEIPDNIIPENFIEKTIILNGGKEVPGLSFEKADLTVLYLENESKAGNFYIYNGTDNYIYPFVKLTAEESYVIILMPDDETVPEGYTACTLSIEGKGIVNAYQYQATRSVDPSDFYLIYCMNSRGTMGWYQYDSLEGTYQRYAGIIPAGTVQPDTEVPSESETNASNAGNEANKDDQISEEPIDFKELQTVIICVVVFLGAIVAIIIINVLLKKHRNSDGYEEDDDDDEEEYEDFDDKEIFKKKESEVAVKDKTEETEEKDEVKFIDL
ncbi:MAG: cadherin-like beta sandwich domain-containing protein [Agathobacter sp.]|nr:cadherin-like beta sandwich domain-containing protein [Agathobacter sp.]